MIGVVISHEQDGASCFRSSRDRVYDAMLSVHALAFGGVGIFGQ